MRIVTEHWLFKCPVIREYDAICLGRLILFKAKAPSQKLINHELVHQAQMDRHGIAGFYLRYMAEYALNLLRFREHDKAYREISFEKEAYKKES